MHFIQIPTEQTTAITDLILAILTIIVIILLRRKGRGVDQRKTLIWTWAFSLLTVAAFFGAAAHGFQMSERLNFILWQPINLSLGLVISLFVVGVAYDLGRYTVRRTLIALMILAGIVFYTVTLIIPGAFVVFIIYEALAMIFALVAYLFLALRRKLAGAWLMAMGILVTLIAAAIQAGGTLHVTLIWEFDFNGIFHIVQMPALFLLLSGLTKEMTVRGSHLQG